MAAGLSLFVCPMGLLALALSPLPVRLLASCGTLAVWLQLGITAALALPRLAPGAPAVLLYHGFCLDSTASWFMLITAVVATAALTHAAGFFAREASAALPPAARDIRQFYGLSALFLLAMQLVCCADNLGALWIAIEATTLMSAPLVYYHRSRTALEATWKYLIICSVGIAFALFGTALLFTASQRLSVAPAGSLSLGVLMAHAEELPTGLLRLGFVFTLLGFGTKAGLFPLHAWLPDAHSEAPAPASAMLSGALLNCALVGLWRTGGLMAAAGQAAFVRHTLLPLGLATVLAASLMLLQQRDLKRLLAYSSMENVGLMACAVALGNGPGFALLALNHSLAKAALFLLAGNLLQDYRSKLLADLRGLAQRSPAEAGLFMAGVLAVAGTPLSGNFLAEWQILSAAADGAAIGTVLVCSLGLAIAFIALTSHATGILWGDPPSGVAELPRPGAGRLLVPAALLAATLVLGVALTPGLLVVTQGIR